MANKLTSMNLAVVYLEGESEVECVVQVDNRDFVRFDMIRARKGLPAMEEATITGMSVLAWSALHRSGRPVGEVMHFLENDLLSVAPVDANGDVVTGDVAAAETTVDPTRRDPELDY